MPAALDPQLAQGVSTTFDLAGMRMFERGSHLLKQVDCAHHRLAGSIIEIVVPFDELVRGYHIRRHKGIMTS